MSEDLPQVTPSPPPSPPPTPPAEPLREPWAPRFEVESIRGSGSPGNPRGRR